VFFSLELEFKTSVGVTLDKAAFKLKKKIKKKSAIRICKELKHISLWSSTYSNRKN